MGFRASGLEIRVQKLGFRIYVVQGLKLGFRD